MMFHGIEVAIQTMGRWSPNDLAFVEKLTLDCEASKTDIHIDAMFQPETDSWPNFNSEFYRVQLIFTDSTGLTLKGFGGGWTQIIGFDIMHVGDRGLESHTFEVFDYEDGKIEFQCKQIQIVSISDGFKLNL